MPPAMRSGDRSCERNSFSVYAPVEIGGFRVWDTPGGNITGVVINVENMVAKRVQLLKELVPTLNGAPVPHLWHAQRLSVAHLRASAHLSSR